MDNIYSGHIVFARGTSHAGGHAWLYTGAIAWVDSVINEFRDMYKLYVNWGWAGNCDGWCIAAQCETPSNGSGLFNKDNAQVYIVD